MANGEHKYGLFNWRHIPVPADVYYDAMLRHLLAWLDGEDYAQDSGCHHLAHVMACCAVVLDAREQGTLMDNRGVPGKAPGLIGKWTQVVDYTRD